MGDAELLCNLQSEPERTPVVSQPTAVLASGGMDSCILLANEAKKGVAYPIYVETGIPWEWAEKKMLNHFINALNTPNIKPITTTLASRQSPIRRHALDDVR